MIVNNIITTIMKFKGKVNTGMKLTEDGINMLIVDKFMKPPKSLHKH